MKTKTVKKDITNYFKTTKDEKAVIRNRWYQRKFQLTRLRKKIESGKEIGKGYTIEQIDEQLKKTANRIKSLNPKVGRPKKTTVTNVTS